VQRWRAAACGSSVPRRAAEPFEQQACQHGPGDPECHGEDDHRVLEQRHGGAVSKPYERADRVLVLPGQRVRAGSRRDSGVDRPGHRYVVGGDLDVLLQRAAPAAAQAADRRVLPEHVRRDAGQSPGQRPCLGGVRPVPQAPRPGPALLNRPRCDSCDSLGTAPGQNPGRLDSSRRRTGRDVEQADADQPGR